MILLVFHFGSSPIKDLKCFPCGPWCFFVNRWTIQNRKMLRCDEHLTWLTWNIFSKMESNQSWKLRKMTRIPLFAKVLRVQRLLLSWIQSFWVWWYLLLGGRDYIAHDAASHSQNSRIEAFCCDLLIHQFLEFPFKEWHMAKNGFPKMDDDHPHIIERVAKRVPFGRQTVRYWKWWLVRGFTIKNNGSFHINHHFPMVFPWFPH